MNNQDLNRPDVFHNRVYNDDIIKGRWLEIKGGVRKLWGNLTDDELEETKGQITSIAGLIERKYGEARASIDQKLDGVFHQFYDEEATREAAGEDSEDNESYDSDMATEDPVDAANRNARERQL